MPTAVMIEGTIIGDRIKAVIKSFPMKYQFVPAPGKAGKRIDEHRS
jgi:hypothetical protein